MIETIFDSLNAKAAAVAVQEIYQEQKLKLPLILSAAVGLGGETMISAQKVEAFWNAFAHTHPLAIGLNCSLGPDLMRPHLEELSDCATTHVSCYPNAGLPNPSLPPASIWSRSTWRITWPSSPMQACSTSPAAAAATLPTTSPPSPGPWLKRNPGKCRSLVESKRGGAENAEVFAEFS